jgi:hypothetical protein
LQVEVPEPVTFEGLHETVRPLFGLTVVDRLTVPVKPFLAPIVVVNELVVPLVNVTLGGFVEIVKSGVGGGEA